LLVVLVGACALGAMAQMPGLLTIPVAGQPQGGISGAGVTGGFGSRTGGMSDAEKNQRRNFNNEFNDLSLIGFHAFSIAGSFNLNTTCPGQPGNTIPVGETEPAMCIACPCNLPVQLAATLCVDSRRAGNGTRTCTLTFIGAIGGVAVRGVSTDSSCQITVTRHGEATIMSGLKFNPSSAGGVSFPTFTVLRATLVSESKFFIASVGGFSFAGFGERSVRRFNPFFSMKGMKHGAVGGLGGMTSDHGGDLGAAGLGAGGLGAGGLGSGHMDTDADRLAAFIARRFLQFRCPSVAGFLYPQDPRINDDDAESSMGRFNVDDETFIGNGNNIDDFAKSSCGEGMDGIGASTTRMNDEFAGGGW